jgi:hypothetical protein
LSPAVGDVAASAENALVPNVTSVMLDVPVPALPPLAARAGAAVTAKTAVAMMIWMMRRFIENFLSVGLRETRA